MRTLVPVFVPNRRVFWCLIPRRSLRKDSFSKHDVNREVGLSLSTVTTTVPYIWHSDTAVILVVRAVYCSGANVVLYIK